MSKNATQAWLDHLRGAVKTLDALDVNERLRSTLRRAVEESITRAEDSLLEEYSTRNDGNWKADEIAELERELAKIDDPMTYGQEQMVLIMLGERLGKPQKKIKKKAIELGHGRKVDYYINTERD